MEGLIGALYLDGGLSVAEAFIKKYWQEDIDVASAPADSKTALQEYAQAHGLPLPVYKVVEHSGPSHAPCFVIEGRLSGFDPVRAEGGSKRETEKKVAAAMNMQFTTEYSITVPDHEPQKFTASFSRNFLNKSSEALASSREQEQRTREMQEQTADLILIQLNRVTF